MRIDIDLVLCVYLEGRCTWFVSVIDCLSIKICSVILAYYKLLATCCNFRMYCGSFFLYEKMVECYTWKAKKKE